jgi:hypothetical protein
MIWVIQSGWFNLKWFFHLPQCQEEGAATYSSACFGHFLPWLRAAQHIFHIKPGNSVDQTNARVSIGIQLIDHQWHVSLEKKEKSLEHWIRRGTEQVLMKYCKVPPPPRPPMPPHVPYGLCGLPPGCDWSVTDFWGWDAHEAWLRFPDEVDPEGALNLNLTTQTMVTTGILPY